MEYASSTVERKSGREQRWDWKRNEKQAKVKESQKEIDSWEYAEKVFWGYLVIGFIIQVHDFNFSLLLSKAGRAAGGRLVVSWITAYVMSCSAPSQCLDDIMGMEIYRKEPSIQSITVTFPFSQQKCTSMCLHKLPFFNKPFIASEVYTLPHTQEITICLCILHLVKQVQIKYALW